MEHPQVGITVRASAPRESKWRESLQKGLIRKISRSKSNNESEQIQFEPVVKAEKPVETKPPTRRRSKNKHRKWLPHFWTTIEITIRFSKAFYRKKNLGFNRKIGLYA